MNEHSNNDGKQRLPPGQHLTERFPVLQKGTVCHMDRTYYKLEITGEVEKPATFSLNDLNRFNHEEIIADIHCVTSWSKYDTKWGGIPFNKILDVVKLTKNAHFVEFYCADGDFTTTVPLDAIKTKNALLALTYEKKPISDDHGGPVRAVIPHLYFYKSAKWVIKIIFLEKDRLGYWERGGYSNKADPWKEQRYAYHD